MKSRSNILFVDTGGVIHSKIVEKVTPELLEKKLSLIWQDKNASNSRIIKKDNPPPNYDRKLKRTKMGMHMHRKRPATPIGYVLRLILFVGVLMLAVGSSSSNAVRAAQQEVSLEILPSVIQLKPNKPVEVLLILRNSTTSALERLVLTAVTSLDVEVKHDDPDKQLPAGGVLSLKATLTQLNSDPAVGDVHFRFSYEQASDVDDTTLPGAVSATLEIQEPPVEKVEEMAQVSIETSLDQVEEQRPGQVFLMVHNLSSQPITITKVTAHKPTFVLLEEPPLPNSDEKPPLPSTEKILLTEEQELAPQKTYVLTIPVRLIDAVQTGPHRVLFAVDLQWEKDGEQVSGSLAAAHTITAGILGESDLLKLVGAPSILFLPGFLMLTMFVMLSGRLPPRIQFNLSTAEFALFSISLSLLTALAYPRITGLYGGESRSYLRAYGLTDIFLVWFGSVAVGFVGWALFFGLTALAKRWRARQMRNTERERQEELATRTPQVGDNPVRAVEKMGMNDVPIPQDEAEIMVSGHSLRGFILMTDPADPSAVWVSPSILLKPREDPGLGADQYRERRNRDLEQIAAAQTARDLAAVLGRAADTWDIEWNERGALSGPRRVLQAELKDRRRAVQPFVAPE